MNNRKLVIPCLQGALGTWTTYTCLMRLADISHLVHFATELHSSRKLSELIQRQLEDDRIEEIANYLIDNPERFFNALVLAIYDGHPQWHSIQRLEPQSDEALQIDMPDYARECLGFLTLSGEERLFALDGQHRLAGIKNAIRRLHDIGPEQLTVIIVVHKQSPEGIKKSRRLFTTLNKKAKLVTKDAIIALDEDDIAACITRWLLEESNLFNEDNVSFVNGSLRDQKSITTLVNIYDCTRLLVADYFQCKLNKIDELQISDISPVLEHVNSFYSITFREIPELAETVKQKGDPAGIKKYRNSQNGGHLLFRPLGWDLYTAAVIKLKGRGMILRDAIKHVSKKDLNLSGGILGDKLWSVSARKIRSMSASDTESVIDAFAMLDKY